MAEVRSSQETSASESPLRTRATGSQLQSIIRHIQHNDFFKFNVHRKLQGGLPVSDIYNS
jgi:hypothetical protein